jgi:hypothetical protein
MKTPTRNALMTLLLSLLVCAACGTQSKQSAQNEPGLGPAPAGLDAPSAATPVALNGAPAEQPAAAGSSTGLAPASKKGWWIRINKTATLAQAVTLQIGTSKYNREEWLVWRAGNVTEFDVPEKYAQAPRLYLRGNVAPIGRLADLCLMYKTRGVEHMGFDDDESETKSQTAVDYKCRL